MAVDLDLEYNIDKKIEKTMDSNASDDVTVEVDYDMSNEVVERIDAIQAKVKAEVEKVHDELKALSFLCPGLPVVNIFMFDALFDHIDEILEALKGVVLGAIDSAKVFDNGAYAVLTSLATPFMVATSVAEGLLAPIEELGDALLIGGGHVSAALGHPEIQEKLNELADVDIVHQGFHNLREVTHINEYSDIPEDNEILGLIKEGVGYVGAFYYGGPVIGAAYLLVHNLGLNKVGPTQTPGPVVTPTVTPTSTIVIPTKTGGPSPTQTTNPNPTTTPSKSSGGGGGGRERKPTPEPTEKPIKTKTPKPSPTKTKEPAETKTPAPTPTVTATPTATQTPAPTQTSTPEPTEAATPAPTEAPAPEPTQGQAAPPDGGGDPGYSNPTPEPEPAPVPEPTVEATIEPTVAPEPEQDYEESGDYSTKTPEVTNNQITSSTKKSGGNAAIPIIAGISAAAAAGIGAKAYIDSKNNNDNDNEEDSEYDEYDDNSEMTFDDSSDDSYENNDSDTEQIEDTGNDFEEPEKYGARTSEELADLQ